MSEKTEFRQDFSFGWQRARLLGAFFNGAFLLALGISILLQSIERFISLKEVSEVKLMLIMGCVGLGLNIITATFLHGQSITKPFSDNEPHTSLPEHHHHHHNHPDRDSESETSSGTQFPTTHPHQDHTPDECPSKDALKGAAISNHANHHHTQHTIQTPGRDLGMLGALLHVAGDALNNAGVIVAAAVMWLAPGARGRFYADPAVGLAIALTILLSAVPLVRRSGEILLQSAPVGVSLRDVREDIEKVPGVVSVHELHIWRLDQHKAIASAHVIVSAPDLASFVAQTHTIRECLHAYGIHSATLQPELVPPPPSSICPSSSDSVRSGAVAVEGAGGGGDGGDGSGKREEGEGIIPERAAVSCCQMVCGRGMCSHLMCCSGLVQV
ncbi:cation efflux family-domain-containing protein [Chaetomium fimeti]|uniref:Cation efflux family-domain-containing protein n=1 Tax=Chaetomium fimeti TaxID=1854472 RepID=A0AAE0HDW7_9PEZI|nr:cation efflux family-domain-containing protein [Chaetomium fimeti]